MARGRPRKQGRRDSKGKLRPIIMPDRGNDRTAAKREKFGTDGADAIGRAYRAGLLGEDGQILMQTARSFHRAYWPMLGVGHPGCALGDRAGGGGDGNLASERWVVNTVRRIDKMGREHRKAFDELVLDFNPDYGPEWLDRHIDRQPRPSDEGYLASAIRVLCMISKVRAEEPNEERDYTPKRNGLFGAARQTSDATGDPANSDRREDVAEAESHA